jgi:hypothetical protein
MRNGQNKRMRGRNNRGKGQNPLTRVYESNGPDVKIRGTASHVAEKYVQLARDAQGSGDPVAAENYYQHAEHYFRMIAAAQEQFRQTQPFFREGGDGREESFDDGDEDSAHPMMGGGEPGYGPRESQPYMPREHQQPYPRREAQQPSYAGREPQPYGREGQPYGGHEPQARPQPAPEGADRDQLPSFITGGQPQQGQPNGHDNPDRFPLHRRRRRHRGPRGDGAPQTAGSDGGDEPGSGALPAD